jgi:hypothetical protein
MMMGFLVLLILGTVPAWGGVRHYVSSKGSDKNPCTLPLPCRTFARAVNVTDVGGEVIVLKTGDYGLVNITKSVSIIAPSGVYASVTAASSTNGITINAGTSDKVILRGLTIRGSLNSWDGISVLNVGTLSVENCSLSGTGSGAGIFFNAPDSRLIMTRSDVQGWSVGVNLNAPYSGSTVNAVMDSVHLDGNVSYGLYVSPSGTSTIKATVTNSTASNNGAAGFVAQEQFNGGSKTVLILERCVAASNLSFGVYVLHSNTESSTSISNCTLTNNGSGVFRVDLGPGTGRLYTRENNTIIGNVMDVDGTLTPILGQ